MGPRTHNGGEILDLVNLVFGEQELAELMNVEPLVRCAFECSVVEVETIYIDIGFFHLGEL